MMKRTLRGGVLGATLAATLLLPASAALAQSSESVATYQSTDVDCESDTYAVVVDKDLSNVFFRDADGVTVKEYSSDATPLPARRDAGDGFGSYMVAIPQGAVTVTAKAGSETSATVPISEDCVGDGQAEGDADGENEDGTDESGDDDANDETGEDDVADDVATYRSTNVDCQAGTFTVVVDKDLSNVFFRDADGVTVKEYSSDATALPARQDVGDGFGSYTVEVPEGAVTVSAKAGSQDTGLIEIPEDCFEEEQDTGNTGNTGDDDANGNTGDDDANDETGDEAANPFGVCPDITALVVEESDENGHIAESELVEGATFGDADGVLVTIESVTTKDDEPTEIVGFAYSVSGGDIVEVVVKTGDGTYTMDDEAIALPDEDNTAISFVVFCIGEDDVDGGQTPPGNGEDTDDGDTDTDTDTNEVVIPVAEGPEVVVPVDEVDTGEVAGESVERPATPADEDDVLGTPAVPGFTPAPAAVGAAPDAPATVVMGVAAEADTLPATGTGSTALVLLAGLLLLAGAGALRMTRSATVTTR